MNNVFSRTFCVAPMMGYTTPHARYLYSLLSTRSYLFTEMIAAKSIIYSKNKSILLKNINIKNPVAFQIGGSDPEDLARTAEIIQKNGFSEINLNVGCPSKAVQKGRFGACLMKEKNLVKKCLISLNTNSSIKVTMKCRLGVDEFDSYEFFKEFIEHILDSGIDTIYIHARKAILKGLNPKGNRNIPPLKYEYVNRIKEDFPDTRFILNGGINNLSQAKNLMLSNIDGVMVGRLVKSNPFILNQVDSLFYGEKYRDTNFMQITKNYFSYIKENIGCDSIYRLLSPFISIFFGIPNSRNIKIQIHKKIKSNSIDELENFFYEINNKSII